MKIHNEKQMNQRKMTSKCATCSGLCCTALYFSKMDGFPQNKMAGKPCINLEDSFRCRIHEKLESNHMKGCIGYDCFNAGTYVTQLIYGGKSWRELPEQQSEIFDVFVQIFHLFQIRYYLLEASTIVAAEALQEEIQAKILENQSICAKSPEELLEFDIDTYRTQSNLLLKRVIASIQHKMACVPKKTPVDYIGKRYNKKDLSGYDFSMKLLIASQFCNCRFDGAIFLGADTRDADFSNADLREAVFLTQGQINCAKGNRNTRLPENLEYPVTWK